jgi:uncharacterized protein YjdB
MSADATTLVPAATFQLTATAKSATGQALSRTFAWSTTDGTKVTVSSSGLVSGVAPGTATVTAAVDGKSASATITVLDGGVVSSSGTTVNAQSGAVQIIVPADAVTSQTNLTVVPSTSAADPRVVKGTAFEFGPTGIEFKTPVVLRIKYVLGDLPTGTEEPALKIHLSKGSGAWEALPSSVDLSTKVVSAEVAHFSTYAVLVPMAVSAIEIRGPPVVGGAAALQVGTSEQLTATLTASNGEILTDRAVTWASSNLAVASITTGGLVTAVSPGTSTLSASAGGVISNIALTVTPVPAASVTASLASSSLTIGATTQATAVVRASNGDILSGRVVVWTSSNPGVATVSADGTVSALSPGSADITATSEGKTGTASVTVAAIPVASVTVALSSSSVTAVGTAQATATTLAANGGVLTGRSVTWSSSDPAVVTVSAAGVVTAVSVGSANVVATSEGKSGNAAITVTPAPVNFLALSPPSATLVVGGSQQLTATVEDAHHNVLTGRTIDWSTDAHQIATVSASGLVSAVSPGVATIAAVSENKIATATITVTPVPVAAVTVTLAAPSVVVGQATQATAATFDAGGNPLTGRSISWASNNHGVATVSSSGLVTSIAPGIAIITATSETKSDQATLTVTLVPVARVSVNPPSAIMLQGETEQLAVVQEDAQHNVLTGRSVDWSSSNPAVATVSTSGLVTAASGTMGTTTITATSEGQTGSSSITVSQVPVASVSVVLAAGTINVGQNTQANATLLDASGNVLTGRTITWTSDNTAVATVSNSGVATAVAAGSAQIRATSGGQSGSATLTILLQVAAVIVSPASANVVIGNNLQLAAETRDANNNVLSGRAVLWLSNAPLIASVSASGLVNTLALGSATITATSEGKTGTSSITVLPIPVATVTVNPPSASLVLGITPTQQLSATLRDANNNLLAGRVIAWTSSNPAAATVDASGLVTAAGGGSTTITATSETKTGTASITVTAPVATVTVSPSSATLPVGSTHQLNATLKDINSNTLTGRIVTWSSSNQAIATVSSTGLVTAVANGSAVITAASEGKSGTSSIDVTQIPVASVTVGLSASTIHVGQTTQATATTRDAGNNVLTGRVVTWSSGNPAVATVSPSGIVTAVAAGTASILATSEGQSGSATLTVNPAPVVTVTVSPPTTPMIVGGTQQLTATTRDGNGNVLTGRTIAWTSSSTAVLTVTASGSPATVTAVGLGTASITATSESVSSSPTPTITVNPIPVASVTVSLAPTSITAVGASQASATTLDVNGNALAGRVVTWSSSNPAVATVSSTGLVTAVNAGSTNVVATSETKTGSAPLTVTQAPVATVTVSPVSATVVQGDTEQLTVTLRDAHDNALTRPVVWSSSNPGVASVSASGVVTAVSPGAATVTATSEGQGGASSVTVSPVPVATVGVTLASATITDAQTTQATATVRDADGNVLTGRTINWTSDNTAVATVSPTGVVTAVSPGSAHIRAATGGQNGNATLTVIPRVAAVVVSPASANVVLGSTLQLTVEARDANNNVLTGRSITWSSNASSIASVSTSGLVSGLTLGGATITAASEGQNGTSAITVVPVPVALVTVSLASTSITAGQTTQSTAMTRDAAGNILTGRSVTWSSGNPAAATVSATGLVTSVAPGSVQIIATSETKTGSATLTVNPASVATVTVSPATATLVLGITPTRQLSAVTKDSNGNVLTGRVVTWTSSNNALATVSTTGLVTAVAAGGPVTITATSEGQSGASSITVTVAPVATVTVSAPTTPMIVGQTQQLTATTKDANGNALTGRTVNWVSSNTAVLTVSASGSPTTVTAVGVGTATITATSESVSSTPTPTITVNPIPVASVTVSPSAATLVLSITPSRQLTAETRDGNGNLLTGRTLSWASDNSAAATVDANGLVTAVAAGSATITATSEGKNGASAITVTVAPVASVTVSLAPTSITAVGTSQASATTLDANGNPLTGRTITWTSGNTAVATVSATTGVVTGVSVGTASITATSEGQSGSATITVTQAPVATVTVSLAASSINAVQATQATATLLDSQGRALTGRAIIWTSDNASVATVSSAGLVTAVAPGSANITATSETKVGSAPITVTPAPVAIVMVTPSSASLVLGINPTQQLTAVTKDAKGVVLTGRTVLWSSSNNAVATVSTTGLVTGVAGGGVTITATSEGVPGSSSITVTVPTNYASLLHVSTSGNRRYFENASGQPVYLTGSHTWSNLQDNGTVDPPAAFNYTAYLNFLETRNHNFFRLWAWEQAKWTAEIAANYWITPGPFQRTGPGVALDGKPRFDVTQFNQAYFDRLRSRVQDAAARGIYVSIMLFDGWSVGQKGSHTLNNPWKGHPFNAANNINSINGDSDGDGNGLETQTLDISVTPIQDAYVRRVIDAVGDLDNVLYEISNESDPSSRDWQYHMIQVIRDYEATRSKRHPIGMTAMWPSGSDADLFGSDADWISITGDPEAPPTATGSKVLITDTDHLCGICGSVSWVWKSFAKGHNPILMDGYDGAAIGMGAVDYNQSDPIWEQIRKNLGYARSYTLRMDLANAVPHGDKVLEINGGFVPTGYALAKLGSQYLVFIPGGGSVKLNLTEVSGTLNVEWFNPSTGVATPGSPVTGGPSRTLTAPFTGDAVLFLY